MRILSSMTKTTVETYENILKSAEKVLLKQNIREFVKEIMTKKTLKDVVRLIKTQVPTLLGYTACQVFLAKKQIKQLYTVSVEEDESEDRSPEFFGIKMNYIE